MISFFKITVIIDFRKQMFWDISELCWQSIWCRKGLIFSFEENTRMKEVYPQNNSTESIGEGDFCGCREDGGEN